MCTNEPHAEAFHCNLSGLPRYAEATERHVSSACLQTTGQVTLRDMLGSLRTSITALWLCSLQAWAGHLSNVSEPFVLDAAGDWHVCAHMWPPCKCDDTSSKHAV